MIYRILVVEDDPTIQRELVTPSPGGRVPGRGRHGFLCGGLHRPGPPAPSDPPGHPTAGAERLCPVQPDPGLFQRAHPLRHQQQLGYGRAQQPPAGGRRVCHQALPHRHPPGPDRRPAEAGLPPTSRTPPSPGGGATLHLDRSQLTYQEATADLTRNELKILAYLFRHAGTICARGGPGVLPVGQPGLCGRQCPQRQHRPHPGEAGRHRPDGVHPDQAPPGVSDMNGPLYWKGQLPVILLQLAAMVGLALLLLLGGMNGGQRGPDPPALGPDRRPVAGAGGTFCGSGSWRPCWNWPASCRRPTCWGSDARAHPGG